MQRKDFIKTGCVLCLATGAGLISFLESCTPLPLYTTKSSDKKILIPLSEFTKNNFLIVRPADLHYDLAVVKISDEEFKSMIMVCTHADNSLQFNGKEFRCSLHGSMFNRLGKVEKGPAERPLSSLKTMIENNMLVVLLG